ncbi:UNKNOWN [Stylonychia lemnae]|uniref:Uncharacterized protein n=1 Tax=Stylonychia lemnae TaxID=5949 RepID=A0A078ALB8_STYLE|nr:UNKNOWN [Stylonychia lemnae]|eukprot:CDW82207.1 UNKNOWN [Stylonychia lemnae]
MKILLERQRRIYFELEEKDHSEDARSRNKSNLLNHKSSDTNALSYIESRLASQNLDQQQLSSMPSLNANRTFSSMKQNNTEKLPLVFQNNLLYQKIKNNQFQVQQNQLEKSRERFSNFYEQNSRNKFQDIELFGVKANCVSLAAEDRLLKNRKSPIRTIPIKINNDLAEDNVYIKDHSKQYLEIKNNQDNSIIRPLQIKNKLSKKFYQMKTLRESNQIIMHNNYYEALNRDLETVKKMDKSRSTTHQHNRQNDIQRDYINKRSQSNNEKFVNVQLKRTQKSSSKNINGVQLVDRVNQRNQALAQFLRSRTKTN